MSWQPGVHDPPRSNLRYSIGIAHFDPGKEDEDEYWLPDVDAGVPNRHWNALFCIFLLSERGIHMRANNRGLTAIAELLDLVPEPDPDGLAEDD